MTYWMSSKASGRICASARRKVGVQRGDTRRLLLDAMMKGLCSLVMRLKDLKFQLEVVEVMKLKIYVYIEEIIRSGVVLGGNWDIEGR
jgi:hypothetical protein